MKDIIEFTKQIKELEIASRDIHEELDKMMGDLIDALNEPKGDDLFKVNCCSVLAEGIYQNFHKLYLKSVRMGAIAFAHAEKKDYEQFVDIQDDKEIRKILDELKDGE